MAETGLIKREPIRLRASARGHAGNGRAAFTPSKPDLKTPAVGIRPEQGRIVQTPSNYPNTPVRYSPRIPPESGLDLNQYSTFELNMRRFPNARLVLARGGKSFESWAKEFIRPSVKAGILYLHKPEDHLYVVDASDVNHYAAIRNTDFFVAG